jgi:type I restriction enzyme S subunit
MSYSTVALGEVVGSTGLIVNGDWIESKDQDQKGDVRLIQLADVGVSDFLDKSDRSLTSATAQRLRCTYLEPNDILVARMPDPIGRACIFPGSVRPCITVVDVCIVRPDPNLANARYLVWPKN